MIFSPDTAKLIRQAKKSQTRRRQALDTSRCRYEAGKSYAVQPGRGKESICRITVTEVRVEPLGDITLKDARREGFVTTEEFFDGWRSQHGKVDRDELVWVISFDVGDTTDTPRLLAARPGGPGGDYTDKSYLAAREEPEALSESETNYFGKLAHARDLERAKDPDVVLRNMMVTAIEEWEERSGGTASDRERARAIDGIRRQLRTLDRKLKAA